MKEKIKHYFATYQNDECFSTSEGFLFHKQTDAVAHAATLTNKKVDTHKRVDYPAQKETVLPSEEELKAIAAKKAEDKALADQKKADEKKALADQKKADDRKALDTKSIAESNPAIL